MAYYRTRRRARTRATARRSGYKRPMRRASTKRPARRRTSRSRRSTPTLRFTVTGAGLRPMRRHRTF